jgi:hypothetical protein
MPPKSPERELRGANKKRAQKSFLLCALCVVARDSFLYGIYVIFFSNTPADLCFASSASMRMI